MKKNDSISRVLISLLFLVFWQTGFSQKYNFENISDKYFLNQNYIYKINQSSTDELLIASEDGLLKFNGMQFELVKESVLKDESILNKVLVTKTGVIVLGYYDGTLLQKANGHAWTNINHTQEEKGRILQIIEAKNGSVFVLMQNKGVFLIKKNRLKKVALNGLLADEIVDISIVENKLVAITETEIKIYDITTPEPEQVYLVLSGKIKKITGELAYSKVYSNESNYVFILTGNNQLVCCSIGESSEVINIIDLSKINGRLEEIIIRDRSIWIASQFDGLYKLEFSDTGFNSYSIKNFTTNNGLADNHLKSIFIDNRNILWVGYYGAGLSRLVDDRIRLYDGLEAYNIKKIYSVVSDKKELIYLGTNAGLFEFNPGAGNVLKKIPLNIPSEDVIISALKFDANGQLWIGTKENGVFIYEPEKNKAFSVNKKFDIDIFNVNNIEINKNGNVYLATDFGMFYYNFEKSTLIKITSNEGLVHNVLNQICVDDKNTLWFAANDATLFKYDKGEFYIFKDIPNLTSYKLTSIFQDSDGDIVFGTEGDGFFIYNEKKSLQLSSANGLKSDYVYSVLEDNNKNIWAFHKQNISVFNLKTKAVDEIKLESIFNSVISRNAVYKDNGGFVWLGTDKGLLRLSKPGELSKRPPFLSVSKVVLNNKRVPSLKPDYSFGAYSLRFEFLGVNLLNPEGVRYEYILEGFEKKWNVVNFSHNYAYYPKLEDGSYKFRLVAIYKDGSRSREYISTFIINTPLWKSVWFWVILFSLFVVLSGLIFRWRIKYINGLKLKLEEKVRLRTNELRTERNNLVKANIEIERKSNDILDSINYAKRLQNAVLPSLGRWEKVLPNSFIFYMPKAIVAGDFYWLVTENDVAYFAAGDCTGHGVPGAMVSVFCADALTRSVRNRKITNPANILDQTRSFVVEMFENSEEDVRDGMDVSLCRLNLKTLELQWAGANNPLWIIRKGKKEIEIIECDKQPIGNSYNPRPFTNHTLQMNKGDMIYLFTDGYADQFGGPERRKFRTSGLKELLLNISSKDMVEQKHYVYKAFMNWKGATEQIDDICLIGVEI